MKIVIRDLIKEISEVNDRMFTGEPGSPKENWYEEKIFNEERLYESLGKEDARSVLAIWRRYKETVKLLRAIEDLLQ